MLDAKQEWLEDQLAKLPENSRALVDECSDLIKSDKLTGKRLASDKIREFTKNNTVVNWEVNALVNIITTKVLLDTFNAQK